MAVPNVFAFLSRFPEFKETPHADIAMALELAGLWVDANTWDATDYQHAMLFWAAHFLSLKAQEASSAQFGGGTAGLFVRSIGIGERRVMFGERRAGVAGAQYAAVDDLLSQTTYGQLYLALRQRNVPAIAVI